MNREKSIQIPLKFPWNATVCKVSCILPKILNKFTWTELNTSKLCPNTMIYLQLLVCKQCEFCYQEIPTENTSEQHTMLLFKESKDT